jgi:hypothetical protein
MPTPRETLSIGLFIGALIAHLIHTLKAERK